MNEMAPIEQHNLVTLDSLTMQARAYAENAGMNMILLGKTLTQAKSLVAHGEWINWIVSEVGIEVRWAQLSMACYARYGESEEYAALGTSKMQIMLALPPGLEDGFMEENDVKGMSSRELREAVKKAREEAKAEAEEKARLEIEEERKARRAAEARAQALEDRSDEIPEETAEELRDKDREIERLSCQNRDIMDKRDELQRDNRKLQRQLDEQEQLLKSAAQNHTELQKKLDTANAALKQNDADRMTRDELTLDVFSSAVMRFTGVCARLPYMKNTFAVMDNETRSSFDELLRTVEGWCAASRKTLNTIMMDGGVFIE